MNAEEKLAKYRAKKRKLQYLTTANDTIKSLFKFGTSTSKSDSMVSKSDDLQKPLIEVLETENDQLSLDVRDDDDDDDLTCSFSYIIIVKYILYFILWLTLFTIFLKLQFGLVYCVTSAIIAIFINTRSGPKKKDEVSAYSVFNKDCKSIDGTLKAEQFEREIRFGSTAVR